MARKKTLVDTDNTLNTILDIAEIQKPKRGRKPAVITNETDKTSIKKEKKPVNDLKNSEEKSSLFVADSIQSTDKKASIPVITSEPVVQKNANDEETSSNQISETSKVNITAKLPIQEKQSTPVQPRSLQNQQMNSDKKNFRFDRNNQKDNRFGGGSKFKQQNNFQKNDTTQHNVNVLRFNNIPQVSYKLQDLEAKTVAELRDIAKTFNIDNVGELNKHDIMIRILAVSSQSQGNNIAVEGILELMSDGTHGVLRSVNLLPSENDVYVSLSQIRRFNMRMGDYVIGMARLPKDNERYLSMLRVDTINGTKAEDATNRPYFERMTPIFPNRLMNLETDSETISTRLIDMLAPIGYGQRGMVVAPPKAGKTWLLKDIARGISSNHPEVHLMVVLIAERPEEVTDMARFVKGEVFAANFDDSAENQVKVAELSLERAKRMVESGKDVVILLDSITRLARAYNVVMPTSGRTLSGGMDPIALYPPKRFFGAARNFENGKSLTIIATALVDTGSKMDDVVFEEFKGTGNMELHLDRSLTERRVFPAINIKESGTRNEELLLGKELLAKIWGIRRLVEEMKTIDAVMAIVDRLKKTKDNKTFFETIHDIA